MSQKLKAIYDNGVLKPLEALTGISNQQILDITIDNTISNGEVVQLGGTLQDHPLDNLEKSIKELRQNSWDHIAKEIDNE